MVVSSCDLKAPRCTTTVPQVRLHGPQGVSSLVTDPRGPRWPHALIKWWPASPRSFTSTRRSTHTHTRWHQKRLHTCNPDETSISYSRLLICDWHWWSKTRLPPTSHILISLQETLCLHCVERHFENSSCRDALVVESDLTLAGPQRKIEIGKEKHGETKKNAAFGARRHRHSAL